VLTLKIKNIFYFSFFFENFLVSVSLEVMGGRGFINSPLEIMGLIEENSVRYLLLNINIIIILLMLNWLQA